ncbi:MAG TPA: hypothetical protein VFV95_14810 [Vicinamibacterales bacterium]|nr:hypothetical protein [Vicinamibacterales bacterium]
MKYRTRATSGRFGQLLRMLALCMALVSLSGTVFAQNAPPRQDHPATKPNVGKFYDGAGAILGAAASAMVHVYEFTRDLVVPGSGSGPDAFKGLREGTIVVVHYNEGAGPTTGKVDPAAAEGRQSVEGTVRDVNNRRREITVRFDSKTSETFQLTERPATAGEAQVPASADDVVIDYSDASGQRVSHQFRRKS